MGSAGAGGPEGMYWNSLDRWQMVLPAALQGSVQRVSARHGEYNLAARDTSTSSGRLGLPAAGVVKFMQRHGATGFNCSRPSLSDGAATPTGKSQVNHLFEFFPQVRSVKKDCERRPAGWPLTVPASKATSWAHSPDLGRSADQKITMSEADRPEQGARRSATITPPEPDRASRNRTSSSSA
jgi:hypothetical protein